MAGEEYIDNPTHIRIFFSGWGNGLGGYCIDGADDEGGYTEATWDCDGSSTVPLSLERAEELAPEFAEIHGWGDLPIRVLDR